MLNSIQIHFLELERRIGNLVEVLGHVRHSTAQGQPNGQLLLTTNGLFFIPDLEIESNEGDQSSIQLPILIGVLFGLLISPVSFLLLIVRSLFSNLGPVEQVRRRIYPRPFGDNLALELTETPGMFFLSAREIKMIERKGNWWIFVRRVGKAVSILPDNREEFVELLVEQRAQTLWRDVNWETHESIEPEAAWN